MDYLSKEESEALEKFTRGVRSLLGDNLLILKLFGSKAKGDFSKESDIDVLLVVKKITSELRDKIFDLLLDIELEYDPKISLVILSEYEYQRNAEMGSPFIAGVEKDGVPI
ncbi:MAG: nucleotidyltransferase domain-containing protein [bacterium]